GANLVGEAAHVIGGGDGRAGAAFQAFGDVEFARFGFRVQAVQAFGIEAVAAQFGEAGAAPDVGGDAEVFVEEFGGGDDFAEDGAASQQLHVRRGRFLLRALALR